MKIRWMRNSVRLRITPAELKSLQQNQPVCEEFRIGAGAGAVAGAWSAEVRPGASETNLTLENGKLSIQLSAADCARLSEPQNEGVYFQHNTQPELSYFIEKDFPCAHPRADEAREAPSETFTPPPNFEERKNKSSFSKS